MTIIRQNDCLSDERLWSFGLTIGTLQSLSGQMSNEWDLFASQREVTLGKNDLR